MRGFFPFLEAIALASCPSLRPAFAHGADQPQHRIASLGRFELEAGGSIDELRMSYVTHGKLDASKGNAILVLHGLGGIGFEHSTSPTSSGLKMSFPAYNSRDMMRAQYKLVTEGLHLAHLLAVAGASMGADQALQLAVLYPGFMDGILSLSGGALWSSGVLFFGPLMQSVIESCAGWGNGNYEAISSTCGANAVSVLVPYFYTRDWWDTNIKTPEAFSRWRKEMGDYYLDVQDARDLYHLSKALGRAFIGDSPGFNGDAGAALGSIRARTLFIVSPQDPFLPRHMEAQVKLIPNARMVSIDSIAGHFACCGADRQATAVVSKAMRRFLGDLVRPRTR